MPTMTSHNPDVLLCLANLSSDEVFTPPALANQMLDLLPADLWSNPDARFLDPACKSGVFLREIAKRLDKGLESQIPDRQERINHIMTRQLYGIAITELTALIARRTLYCSKTANGKYSICTAFNTEEGNIRFQRTEHTWRNGRCIFCGASEANYARGEELETHAYEFIHTENPEEIFNMKFDVIIGNPPYQLNDGGGTGSSARPIYQLFISQAKKLNPRYLVMIIPARWFSGGKGLDGFRRDMLNDDRIRHLTDYIDSNEVFPGVDIAGGICYFLWDRDNRGYCTIENIHKGKKDVSVRPLNEFETFVRDKTSISIIKKILLREKAFLNNLVSTRNPFGIASKERPKTHGDLVLIWSGGQGSYPSEMVRNGKDLIDKWKVLISKASFDHGGQPDKEGKRRIFSLVETMPPRFICTESYLTVGPFTNQDHAENMVTFLKTKFCRFLVSTILFTQNITRDCFRFVPNLSMDILWTDEKLYERYGLTEEEIAFIESKIRPMPDDDLNGAENEEMEAGDE
ncbi:Eco57I restriction-modification methylase domain-containing protein [Thermosynechococcus sp. B0]|uniref:Eco57I restriction-modification methylase domain-containing protein n=1 Tax=Thermosynechococcus sp. B0 TaxID=2937284 RepID=UPI0025780727|nr:Eco57I restriction-modification methylase domain-containing protein [Thermosynechococcus sp. B0]WJI23519.1 Eco57I restriction-modification methylase domain-containing protein [Thermosynechococcus sp. B0]